MTDSDNKVNVLVKKLVFMFEKYNARYPQEKKPCPLKKIYGKAHDEPKGLYCIIGLSKERIEEMGRIIDH